jgi:hypothetical protein
MKAARDIRRAAVRFFLAAAMFGAAVPMASAQDAPALRPAGGPQEGITVRGRWVVEVVNPDGTLASRTEFNNALAGGGQHLVSLLGKNGVAGRWVLYFSSTGSDLSPCQGGTGGTFPNWCRIIDSLASNPNNGNAESKDLVVTPSGSSLSLTGTITALSNGVIGRVATGFAVCTTATPIANCNVAGGGPLFSDATLGFAGKPAPVPVVAGQIIKLTVTFTFS